MKRLWVLVAGWVALFLGAAAQGAVLFDIDFTGETVGQRPPTGSAVSGGTATRLTTNSPNPGNVNLHAWTQTGTLNGVAFGDGNFLQIRDVDGASTIVSLAASLHSDDIVHPGSENNVAVVSFDFMRAGLPAGTGTFFFTARGGDKDTTDVSPFANFSLNTGNGALTLVRPGYSNVVVDTIPADTQRAIQVELNYGTGMLHYSANGSVLASEPFDTTMAFKRLTMTTGSPTTNDILVGMDNIQIEAIPEPGVLGLVSIASGLFLLRRRVLRVRKPAADL